MKFLRILSWAVFLGASWTWCIGMFLPVLLVRDLGIWAWVVFAIPNVVGAAAMAWVLPDAQASVRLVATHRAACRAFSIVTLFFHAFFVGWFFECIVGNGLGERIFFPLAAAVVLVLIRPWQGRMAALAAMVLSIFAAAALSAAGRIPHLPPPVPASADLIWVGLVCGFGLALCPYLDLTFHQARQASTPGGGRVAFALGFGVVFFAMLLFTLAYSGWLGQAYGDLPVLVLLPLGVHIIGQSSLKFGLHFRAIAWERRWSAVVCAAALLAAAALGGWSFNSAIFYHGLSLFEITYRCFMAFYGLVFPAYVWICVFGRGNVGICAATVFVAMPMYWMGFIERQMIWLLPGVAIVIAARFIFSQGAPISRSTIG